MLKKDLLSLVAETSGEPESVVRAILEATQAAVLQSLSSGTSVMLFGLGKLSIVHRGAKKARDLHSGAVVMVDPRNVAVLRASAAVRTAINPA